MKNRLLFLVPLFLLAGLVAYLYAGLGRDPETIPSALLDKPVPEFAAPALLEDRPGLTSTDLRGEPQLVNVFASWCVPCRVEHPVIEELTREQGVTVNGLNWKDRPEKAKAWLAELGNPYARIGHDRTGRIGIDLGVYGVPETYVVDAEGIIRFKHTGPLQDRHVEQEILPLLQKLKAE